MNLLVAGSAPRFDELLTMLENAGLKITYWNGELPLPCPPHGAERFDGLILSATLPRQTLKHLENILGRDLRSARAGISPDCPRNRHCDPPVLVGAYERKNGGERFLSCNLTRQAPPPVETGNPFGHVIYEFHAPCEA